jgi:hypothetical protein
MKGEYNLMWNVGVMAYLKVLYLDSSEGTNKEQE